METKARAGPPDSCIGQIGQTRVLRAKTSIFRRLGPPPVIEVPEIVAEQLLHAGPSVGPQYVESLRPTKPEIQI